jgi:hypothetical protein
LSELRHESRWEAFLGAFYTLFLAGGGWVALETAEGDAFRVMITCMLLVGATALEGRLFFHQGNAARLLLHLADIHARLDQMQLAADKRRDATVWRGERFSLGGPSNAFANWLYFDATHYADETWKSTHWATDAVAAEAAREAIRCKLRGAGLRGLLQWCRILRTYGVPALSLFYAAPVVWKVLASSF